MEQKLNRLSQQAFSKTCFALAVVLLLILTFATFHQAERLINANTWLIHTHRVIEASSDLLANINQADTAQRGYLLTGNPAFLVTMQSGLTQAARTLGELQSLVRDNPGHRKRLAQIQPVILEYQQLARQLVQLRQQEGFQAAVNGFRNGATRQALTELRQRLAEMKVAEQNLLQQREKFWLEQSHGVDAILLIGDLLSLSLLVWGFLLLQRQIRQRTKAEQAHQDAEAARHDIEQRFALMSETVEDYAMILLDPQGHIISWNPGAERIKGYTAEEITGRHFSAFYVDEDQAAGKPQRALAIAAQTGKYREEAWRTTKSGQRFWADVSITALKDATGNLKGYAKITRDMTERMRHEGALRLAYERLEKRVQLRTAQLFQEKDSGLLMNVWKSAYNYEPHSYSRKKNVHW